MADESGESVQKQIDTLARTKMTVSKDYVAAVAEVFREHPEFYERRHAEMARTNRKLMAAPTSARTSSVSKLLNERSGSRRRRRC